MRYGPLKFLSKVKETDDSGRRKFETVLVKGRFMKALTIAILEFVVCFNLNFTDVQFLLHLLILALLFVTGSKMHFHS